MKTSKFMAKLMPPNKYITSTRIYKTKQGVTFTIIDGCSSKRTTEKHINTALKLVKKDGE